jgi:transporter family-2 protein
MNNSFFYVLIMFVAGLGIPTMAALNGGLGARLQSPALASVILFFAALLVAVPYLLITQGIPKTIYSASIPWYFYGGGLFVMFYIVTITWVAPHFGLSNAVAFVLLGQLVAMSAIDHFGLFGVLKNALSTQRCMGLLLMAVGVFMVLSRKTS